MLFCSLIAGGTLYAAPNESQGIMNVQQDGACTGVVKDANGEVIIGASIVVKGTTNGVITDIDGNFQLKNVQVGDIIQISYIGYRTQEVKYEGQPLNITLREDTELLDEVVVVGYATVKKANLTGAVSAVDDEVLADRPIVNLGQGLQGTIPNLNITTNGQPGSGTTFNVRGETSINGGNPLVLVDGVEMDPDLINPQDVASVSVLKDAASASIYGARAAFGVVLITTKGGKKNQPTRVSLDASVSFNSPTTRPKYMDSMQYATWMNAANNTTNGRDLLSQEEMEHIQAYYNDPVNNLPVFIATDPNSWQYGNCQAGKYAYCGNTDWIDEIYKKSYPLQKYNVNISGGSEKTTYYTSLGYMDQGSILRYGDEQYRKFNVVNNISYDVNKWLSVSMKTTFIRTEQNGVVQDNVHGNAWIGNDTQPLMPVKHPDGNWAGQGNYTNFAAVMEEGGSRKTTQNDVWNTFAVEVKPLDGLSIKMDYTFNYYSAHYKNHMKTFAEYGADGRFLQNFQYTNPNYVSESQYNDTYNAFNLVGNYEKTWGKHYFKAMLGYNQETKHQRYFYAYREELIYNDLPSMSNATGDRSVSNSDDSWATRSGFARINYSFNDRYLLELNGRYDLSSKFPKNDRSVFSPSFSVGWRLSEEEWFKEPTNNFFDDLKIRASYGSQANQALDSGWYAYLSNYSSGNTGYLFGGQQSRYILPGGLVSNTVTWEKVTQWDLGLDFTILQNRLSGTFDYYQRKTTGMLGPGQLLPNILGANEPQENAADLVSKGWELALTWNDRLDNGFNYSISFNLSDTHAEITKYDNPTKSLSSSYYVGETIGEIWGYESTLFQTAEEIANAPDQSQVDGGISKVPGDIKFIDINGDGVVNNGSNTVDDPGDMKIIGNSTPRYRYGFNFTADWKGIDFGIFFQGVGKRDLYLPNQFRWQYGSQWQVPMGYSNDYWTPNNTDAYLPVARFNGGTALGRNQTRYLLNASYLRLKSLSIGYTLPQTWTQKAYIQKARIYFTAENLFTIKHTPEGFDPELSSPYDYPLQRALSIGVNLTF